MGVSVLNLAIKNVLKNFNNFDLESVIQEVFLVCCKFLFETTIVALFHLNYVNS